MSVLGIPTSAIGSIVLFIIAIAFAVKLRRLVRAFDERQAYNPQTARTLDELGVRESRVFRRLQNRGVIAVVTGGKYYFDRDRWDEFKRDRKRRVLIVLAVLAVALASLIWLSRTQ
jgi:hypothetical protein